MTTKPYINEYDEVQNFLYKQKTKVQIYTPKMGMMIPKDSDYKKGYYYRYFYRFASNKAGMIYEIDDKEYKKLQNIKIYKILKIKWKLIGPQDVAKEINTKIIETSNNVLSGIKSILINPLQFWKNLPDTVPQFDITNKLPRTEIKKKRYNINLVAAVAFDERGLIYILTENNDIIYTEDSYGLLFQG
jgi:hypothetical protein